MDENVLPNPARLQPSPMTEFDILHCFPILVALPITELAPICAECDNVTSAKDVIYATSSYVER
jgi:hypothetical protein